MGRPVSQRGFSLIEVLIVMAIISVIAAIAIPMYSEAIREGREAALIADGRKLYSAMMRYNADHGTFPPDAGFDTTTLDPLTSLGYMNDGAGLTNNLVDQELLAYLAPDIEGTDRHFVAVLRLAVDPAIIVAAVHTNVVTDDGGWVDGVFVIDEEDLADAGL
jgi:prepilin-type N-terminal cleavage/methylation domain-containing protein